MITSLEKVLDQKAVIKINKDRIDSFLLFKELSPLSNIKEMMITRIPDDSYAFTLDCAHLDRKYIKLSSYFNADNSDGINKSCDLVIFSKYGALEPNKIKVNIIVADLKSQRIPLTKTEQQLDNSILFIKYILSVIENYYGIDIEPKFLKRIITTTIRKPTIVKKVDSEKSQTQKITITKFNDSKCSIPYRRLICE